MGPKFFETELSIQKPKTLSTLQRNYFISENITGICTPTLLETNNKEILIFIPELYYGNKHNGFIVKVCENGLCEETKILPMKTKAIILFGVKNM